MRRKGSGTSLAGAALVLGLLAGACAGGSGSGQTPASPVTLPSSPTALPTFDLARFQQLLDTLRGKPVVVNVWASWCGPCIREAPELAKVADRFRGRVQFVGVDIADQLGPARAFIARYRWRFPSVFDPSAAIRDGLGYVGQPVTEIRDASGKTIEIFAGPTYTADELARSLERLVGS